MGKKRETKKSGVLRGLITLILLCVVAFCIYKIVTITGEYREGTEAYEKLAEIGEVVNGPEEGFGIDFGALKEENEDVIAWLFSEGTVINYPVMQGEDNSYYLYRLADRTWNSKGSLFVDYRIAYRGTYEHPMALRFSVPPLFRRTARCTNSALIPTGKRPHT